jgi:hypothetical protein
MKRGWLLLLILAGAIALWWSTPSVIPALIAGPTQGLCVHTPFTKKGYTIQPLMTYRLTARIVASRRYTESGPASISPVDLGLAWGRSADPRRLAKASFSQGGRFMHWNWQGFENAPASDEIANTHIIPQTPELEAHILSAKPGDVIALRGYLVQVDGTWTSSLSRKDSGDGACEIIYVTAFEILPDPETTTARSHGAPGPSASDPAPTAPQHAVSGFKRFPTTITEKTGGRKIEVIILAKEGTKIAFARQDDKRLYVLPLDRLSPANQKDFAKLNDGADVILRKIEMGLYSRLTDLPSNGP